MCRQIKTDTYVGDDRRTYEEWHLDKNVPISIIGALVLYAGLAIWWGSRMETEMDMIHGMQDKSAIEQQERMHDKLLNNRIDNIRQLIGPINQTLIRMDIKLDSINSNVNSSLKEHEDRAVHRMEQMYQEKGVSPPHNHTSGQK